MDNIIIITNKPFPEGFAATNRFTTYSLGMIASGCKVFVHCIFSTENRNKITNNAVKGLYKKINFEYTCGTVIRPSLFVLRFLNKIKGYFNSLLKIWKLNRKEKVTSIILIGPFGLFYELGYYLLTRIARIKLIQERSEYPFLTQKNNLLFKIKLLTYLKLNCKLYDAMLLISNPLSSYYKKHVSGKAKILVVPIVVDTRRFESIDSFRIENEYIAYCGSMSSDKDGIEYLIKAFSIISEKYPSIRLKLIGNKEISNIKILEKQIVNLKISDKVDFTGRVSNEEMVCFLKNAKILALSRPLNDQTVGNFPTKLGEYLATGKPVITTLVGTVNNFLFHKKNAFLAEPGNVEDFAEKLDYVLNNYELALKVAFEGKKLTETTFNYLFQGRKILSFIKSLCND